MTATAPTSSAPPRPARIALELRGFLHDIGYEGGQLSALLGGGGELVLRRADAPVLVRRLPRSDRLATVVKLFLLGAPVDRGEVDRALAPMGHSPAERLIECGVLHDAEDSVAASCRLVPHDGLVLAGDLPEVDGHRTRRDHVTGVNPTTVALASITSREPVGSALDIGTGCGVQALLASRHAGCVIATDVNPRALAFARFNSAINGCGNLSLREGSLFGPVSSERFDLIMSNPPFVISPDSTFTFRDGGSPADGLCRRLVTQLSAHLSDGGVGYVLCNWAVRKGQSWSEPLRAWETPGCDVIRLHAMTEDPLAYSARWTAPDLVGSGDDRGELIDRWLRYYEGEGIEAVASGALVVRRSEGPNWSFEIDDVGFGPDSSGYLRRVIEAQDFTHRRQDLRSLLKESFELAPRSRIDQQIAMREGRLAFVKATLSVERGLGVQGRVDPAAMGLLSELDGRRTLGEILHGAGTELENRGDGPAGNEREAAALAAVLTLYQHGFLQRTARPVGNTYSV